MTPKYLRIEAQQAHLSEIKPSLFHWALISALALGGGAGRSHRKAVTTKSSDLQRGPLVATEEL